MLYVSGMRQGSLFTGFRGRDGRSLARVLILVVLVSLFAGGLNAGAAVGQDPAFCRVDDGGDKGQAPGPQHEPDCCILGPTPFATALAPAPPPAVMPAAAALVRASPAAGSAVHGALLGRANARGPPSAA